jgi:hypothetical protein
MTQHTGWAFTYLFILIALLMAEMYAVGAGNRRALTNVTTDLVRGAPWVGWVVSLFLLWLFIHFSIRVIPIACGREPFTWL